MCNQYCPKFKYIANNAAFQIRAEKLSISNTEQKTQNFKIRSKNPKF